MTSIPSKRKQNTNSDDIEGASDDNESRIRVVLHTDAQTKRFIKAVAADLNVENVYLCNEVYERYDYRIDGQEYRLQQILNKVKPYSSVLQDMSVYGFYKWCLKNDVTHFMRPGWPYLLREEFHVEAAQDALQDSQDE